MYSYSLVHRCHYFRNGHGKVLTEQLSLSIAMGVVRFLLVLRFFMPFYVSLCRSKFYLKTSIPQVYYIVLLNTISNLLAHYSRDLLNAISNPKSRTFTLFHTIPSHQKVHTATSTASYDEIQQLFLSPHAHQNKYDIPSQHPLHPPLLQSLLSPSRAPGLSC
jgi:hypothetical protein